MRRLPGKCLGIAKCHGLFIAKPVFAHWAQPPTGQTRPPDGTQYLSYIEVYFFRRLVKISADTTQLGIHCENARMPRQSFAQREHRATSCNGQTSRDTAPSCDALLLGHCVTLPFGKPSITELALVRTCTPRGLMQTFHSLIQIQTPARCDSCGWLSNVLSPALLEINNVIVCSSTIASELQANT